MIFYQEEELKRQKKERKKHIKVMLIVFFSCLLVAISMIFVSSFVTKSVEGFRKSLHVPFEIIAIVSGFVCLFSLIFVLDEFVLNEGKLISHYEKMLTSPLVSYTGIVTKIEENITVENRITSFLLRVNVEEIEYTFYLLNTFENPFKEGEKITVFTANRYIVKYEEVQK